MLDSLANLKERFQGFVDGQNTFEELKHAVNQEVLNCNDTVIRDFVSNAHRDGLLSDTHFRILVEEISSITGKEYYLNLKNASNRGFSANPPKQLTVLNNRFVLGPIIGSGGMGVVYKARDLRKMEVNDSEDVVAIKVLSSNLRAHPESLIALQREAKKAQRLAHPNIVTVYDFDRDGDVAYMTMEFLDGIPLSKIIQTHAPLPRNQALRIINGIARGVAYAHRHNIIHFDLKPGNIFVLKDGSIKILDFGIACAFKTNEEKSGHALLNGNHSFTAFTPAYASCEMICNMPPTPKDDIYALGCIAHELLTRKHPYDRMAADKAKENNITVKQDKHLNSREYRAIQSAVNLNKDRRTASVNEFLHDLSGAKSSLSFFNMRFAVLAVVALVIAVSTYLTDKIETYEVATLEQANIVKKLDIDNTLKRAESFLNDGKLITSDKNNALSLYHYVLELDPDNSLAKAGIERIKQLYFQYARKAIESNDLSHANSLLIIIEASFGENTVFQQIKSDLNQQLVKNKIESLIEKANEELSKNNYVRPKNTNAYDTFLEILKLDPDDPRAAKGIDSIRIKLLTEAEALIRNNKLKQSEARTKDALLIAPGNADALALFDKITTIRLSDRYKKIQKSHLHNSFSGNYTNSNTEENANDLSRAVANDRLNTLQNKLVELHTKQAEYYISKDILYGFGYDNASFHFNKLLEIDSTNKYARIGLDSAWKSLTSNVNQEIDRNEFDRAIEKLENSKDHFFLFYDINEFIDSVSTKRDKYFSKKDKHKIITSLLSQAKSQIKDNRWTLPKGNNAMESYLEIRKLDPDNEVARTGLKQVEHLFISRIKNNISDTKFSEANKNLNHALAIFPKSKPLKGLKPLITKAKNEHEQNIIKFELSNKIANLSSDALTAIKQKHYILPIGESAYEFYSEITALEPGNTAAIKGLNKAKFLTYDKIEADIRNKNYKLADLRVNRLTQLGVRDKHYDSLRKKLADLYQDNKSSKPDTNISNDYILDLLMFASRQEAKGFIWPPKTNNAYSIYKEILDLKPLNKTANYSLNKLFEERLNFARNLLGNKRWDDAEHELTALNKFSRHKNEKAAISSILNELMKQKRAEADSNTIENFGTF